MLNTNFSTWPSYTQEEANIVSAVLLSNEVNYWTGEEGRKFEKEFASFTDSGYAIAVANGTVALDLAFVALSIGQNYGGKAVDEVIVTSRTFLASASSIVLAGAKPVFADIDINSQNITADSINAVLTKKTKAIIAVHLAGMSCEMDEIMSLAEKHNLFVIEDCAQAHGAKYKGRSVGSIGHIGAWSFCQDKIMTTGGEGGMVTTNNEGFWKKIWAYKDHGKSWDLINNKNHTSGFQWVHESFGTNWRLAEMQSAIGRIQLHRMPEWTRKRQENAQKIDEVVKFFPLVRTVNVPDYIDHAYYKHYLFLNTKFLANGWSRDRIVDEITKLGVPCYQGSCSEVYLETAFDHTNFRPKVRLSNAKLLGETSLMFLVHPTITSTEIDKTCEVIQSVIIEASI